MRHLLAFLLLLAIAAPTQAGDRHHDRDHDHDRRDDYCYNFRRGYEGCPNDAYNEHERPDRYDYGYQGRNDRDRGYEDDDDD